MKPFPELLRKPSQKPRLVIGAENKYQKKQKKRKDVCRERRLRLGKEKKNSILSEICLRIMERAKILSIYTQVTCCPGITVNSVHASHSRFV